MAKNIEDRQEDNLDPMGSFDLMTKNSQVILSEMTSYSRKSFEDYSRAMEQLLAARSPEKAIEAQLDLFKSSFESFMTMAARTNQLFAELAGGVYKPFGAYLGGGKATS